jgi:NADH-quinone oxidoreductase B subunit
MIFRILLILAVPVFGIFLGLLYKGIDRIVTARMQGRVGPPVTQPFRDVSKLLVKENIVPENAVKWVFNSMPALALASSICILLYVPLGMEPVMEGYGDMILVLYLLIFPSLALVFGAFASSSVYADVGGQREMVKMMSYEFPLATAVLSVAWLLYSSNVTNVFSFSAAMSNPVWGLVGVPGFAGLLLRCGKNNSNSFRGNWLVPALWHFRPARGFRAGRHGSRFCIQHNQIALRGVLWFKSCQGRYRQAEDKPCCDCILEVRSHAFSGRPSADSDRWWVIGETMKVSEKMKRVVRSIWVFNWFNSCGFTEILPVVGSRWDMERFGIVPVSSPRHADCLIIGGYQTEKSIKRAQRIYRQMSKPVVVIGLGSCSMSGGMYWDSYSTIKRLSDYLPVDLYIPGCPPRPEAIFQGILKMVEKVNR